ncbi:MAG: hypothetical protein NWF07_16030, partial [Candidatus Bathyarchaeota archaeon]|nr:hypothetical protein [Candidatus Bathyarchaeota archaeon]
LAVLVTSYISQRSLFKREVFRMAGVKVHPIEARRVDENEARVAEFEDGVRRGIEQYKTGQVQMFDDKAKFMNHLRSL